MPVSTPESGIVARARQIARDQALAFPALVFGLHWAFVTIIAALAMRFARSQPVVKAVGYQLPELDGWQHLTVQPMRNWDGFWYSLIAEQGYDVHPATTAFWPLYPWTMRFVSEVFGVTPELAGWALSNVAFYAALVILYRLVRLEWGDGVARRSVWLLAFFPTAFYFSAVYSESFFLLFSVLAFYWARTGRWWQAGLAAACAALTRNVGVLLGIPMVIMFARQYRVHPRYWPSHSVALLLPALGPLIYFTYLGARFNNPLLTLDVQKGWAREQGMPWQTFQMASDQLGLAWLRMLLASPTWETLTSHAVRFSFSEYESLDLIVTLLVLPLVIYCLRKLPLEYSLYAAIVFVLPMFSPSTIHPLMSFPRFTLVLFPLFVGLAVLTRNRWAFAAVLIPSVALLAVLTIQFSTWYWVA